MKHTSWTSKNGKDNFDYLRIENQLDTINGLPTEIKEIVLNGRLMTIGYEGDLININLALVAKFLKENFGVNLPALKIHNIISNDENIGYMFSTTKSNPLLIKTFNENIKKIQLPETLKQFVSLSIIGENQIQVVITNPIYVQEQIESISVGEGTNQTIIEYIQYSILKEMDLGYLKYIGMANEGTPVKTTNTKTETPETMKTLLAEIERLNLNISGCKNPADKKRLEQELCSVEDMFEKKYGELTDRYKQQTGSGRRFF